MDRPVTHNTPASEQSSGPRAETPSRIEAYGTSGESTGPAVRRIRVAAKIALFLCIVLFLNHATGWLARLFAFQMWPQHVHLAFFLLFASVFSYIVLLAIPFLPGIEVGLLLMAMLGVKGIVLVYLCTVLSLTLSFLLGRLLPPRVLSRSLDWFHLRRAREMVDALEPLDPQERLRFLAKNAPSRAVPFLLRHRFLVLGILFNLPGNALVGGGGGIGLIAGMSRLFPFPNYLLLICLAITPGPIVFLLRASLP